MKIIWAIDAFEDHKELNDMMALYLTRLHEKCQAEVEPLYLLRENEIILPTYEVPTWVTDHSHTAEAMFKEVLASYNLPFLKDPKVIPHTATSHGGTAEALSEYATRAGADLILIGSHGRKGLQRFFLGSFAESLLLQSRVPCLVIGAHVNRLSGINNILFPTEFGEHSKENYQHVLNLAKMFGAQITLLHAITRPIESLFEVDARPQVFNYDGKMMTLEQIVEMQIELQSRKAQQWTDWAYKEGVNASYIIDNTFKSIDDLITDSVEVNEIDLVVMEAQSGPMSAAILGSNTRNVTRMASCPVYVITRHYYDLPKGASATELRPPF